MPRTRNRMRPILILSALALLYHWAFGLPSFGSVQQHLAKTGILVAPDRDGGLAGVSEAGRGGLHVSHGHDFSVPWKKRIVAVGDLHGDLSHALRVLRAASLVDHRGYWIGGSATLVQTGDIVDRGRDTIALYRLFDTLRAQAQDSGGEVISLLGNHELMNAMGDWRYVTKDDIATFGGEESRRKAFSSGWIGQTFLANYSIAARVPYYPSNVSPLHSTPEDELESPFVASSVVAVHGGIHPSWADVSRINEVGSRFVDRLVNPKLPGQLYLPRDTPDDEKDLYSATGPLWYRGYALDDEADGICAQAEQVLRSVNATRMIMGHTPHFKGILPRCRGKIIIIDTGISSAYGGVLSALEILYSLTPVLDEDGEPVQPGKVTEKETVTALYEGRKQVIAKKERVVQL